jgi:hypothetical protein
LTSKPKKHGRSSDGRSLFGVLASMMPAPPEAFRARIRLKSFLKIAALPVKGLRTTACHHPAPEI